ncbi:MAG: hypothetical protein NVS4B8_29090 [Herpetosiphon sp.]
MIPFRVGAVADACTFVCEHGEGELLPARDTGSLRMLALENTQVLAEQQDLKILAALGASVDDE